VRTKIEKGYKTERMVKCSMETPGSCEWVLRHFSFCKSGNFFAENLHQFDLRNDDGRDLQNPLLTSFTIFEIDLLFCHLSLLCLLPAA